MCFMPVLSQILLMLATELVTATTCLCKNVNFFREQLFILGMLFSVRVFLQTLKGWQSGKLRPLNVSEFGSFLSLPATIYYLLCINWWQSWLEQSHERPLASAWTEQCGSSFGNVFLFFSAAPDGRRVYHRITGTLPLSRKKD